MLVTADYSLVTGKGATEHTTKNTMRGIQCSCVGGKMLIDRADDKMNNRSTYSCVVAAFPVAWL